jgi:hypothetical protein
MAPFLPIRATSRSQAVRIGKQTVKTGTTTYVDVGSQTETGGIKAGSTLPFSPFKELQNHLAIGAVVVVGSLTATNSDWVVNGGYTETKAKGGKEEETEVIVAVGELRQRSTGKHVQSAATTVTLKEPATTKERTDNVVVSETTGVITAVEGVEAVVGKSVAPAVAAGTYLLYQVVSKNKNTAAPVITDKREFS